jgi:hypothetical protein
VTATGQIVTYTVGGSVSRQLSPLDELLWSTRAVSTTYNESTSTPFKVLTNSADWVRHLNSTTDLRYTAAFDWTLRDDAANSETQFGRLLTGVKKSMSRQLTFNASAGVGIVKATGVATTFVNSSTPSSGSGGVALDWLANADFSYKFDPRTTITASVAQTILPDVFGNLVKRQLVSAGILYDLNERSGVSLFGTFQNVGASQGAAPSQFWSLTAAFDYRPTQNLRTQIAYLYRQRFADATGASGSSSATSNGVMFLVARDFVVLP